MNFKVQTTNSGKIAMIVNNDETGIKLVGILTQIIAAAQRSGVLNVPGAGILPPTKQDAISNKRIDEEKVSRVRHQTLGLPNERRLDACTLLERIKAAVEKYTNIVGKDYKNNRDRGSVYGGIYKDYECDRNIVINDLLAKKPNGKPAESKIEAVVRHGYGNDFLKYVEDYKPSQRTVSPKKKRR